LNNCKFNQQMCGRAACTLDPKRFHQTVSKFLGTNPLKWVGQDSFKPTYNLTPTNNLPVIYKTKIKNESLCKEELESDGILFKSASKLLTSEEQSAGFIIHTMQWGIPVTIENVLKPVINARLETIFEKPMFKKLLPSHRCVVFIDGYYEWHNGYMTTPINGKKIPTKSQKQIYFICPKNNRVKEENPQDEHIMLCIAGLWESRKVKKEDKEEIEYYFTLVSLSASEEVTPIHHRMPAILTNRQDIETWLGDDTKAALSVLNHPQPGSLDFKKVSDFVAKARNDGKRCIELKTESKGTLHAFFKKISTIKQESTKRKVDQDYSENVPKKIKLEEPN
jgi:putative SOS response-associated peptidase YedK